MKYTKRIVALLLAAVIALGLLTGCGKNDDEMSLRVSLPEGITTLDPAMVTTDTEKMVVNHLFENLMKFSNDGEGGVRAGNGMARNYQCEENLDGTETYTFTLRSGLKWSDGSPVTADDFVFAWRRLVNPATNSPNAALLDMVEGYDAVRNGGDVEKLQVSAPDERTLVVTLSHRCTYFVDRICTAAATMPVRSDVVNQKNWSMSAETLVANGAYSAIQSWQDEILTVGASEEYYDRRRLGPKELNFAFYEDEEADFRLDLSQKEIDAQPETWNADPYPQVTTLVINQMAENMSSEKVRQAMSLVIDRNVLAEMLPARLYRPAEGVIPYGIHNTEGADFRTAVGSKIDNKPDSYEQNCRTAQELIEGETLPAAGSVTLAYVTDAPGMEEIAAELQRVWTEKLQLTVTLQPLQAGEMSKALNSGDFVIALARIRSDRGDPIGLLSNWRSGDPKNWANIHSNAYNLLIRISDAAASPEARDAYLADAERMLLEESYVIPLYNEGRAALLRDGLTGLGYDGMGCYYFSNVVKMSK